MKLAEEAEEATEEAVAEATEVHNCFVFFFFSLRFYSNSYII